MELSERYQGCLVGLAVGDALGTTLEFKNPGTFEPIKDMIGGGPFELEPGQWTDDTSMALCLGKSLIEKNGFDPKDQMEKYCRWMDEGYMSSTGTCFDIGNTVRSALARFKETGDPFSGSTDPHSAGNGSLMRLAPIPLYFANHPWSEINKYCADSSRTTHATQATIDACRYFGGLIIGSLHGNSKEEVLSENFCPEKGYWDKYPLCDEINEIASGSFKKKEPPDITGSGYVVRSLEASLWAFYKSNSFKEGALLAVNLGDDADTTGAIYGQIAGAYYGINGIPEEWLKIISKSEMIKGIADELYP